MLLHTLATMKITVSCHDSGGKTISHQPNPIQKIKILSHFIPHEIYMCGCMKFICVVSYTFQNMKMAISCGNNDG